MKEKTKINGIDYIECRGMKINNTLEIICLTIVVLPFIILLLFGSKYATTSQILQCIGAIIFLIIIFICYHIMELNIKKNFYLYIDDEKLIYIDRHNQRFECLTKDITRIKQNIPYRTLTVVTIKVGKKVISISGYMNNCKLLIKYLKQKNMLK